MNKNYLKYRLYHLLSYVTFGKSRDKFKKKYIKWREKYRGSKPVTINQAVELCVNTKLEIQKMLDTIRFVHIPASITHKEVFTKYKNIHRGKKVVLVGSGPTLKDFVPIEDAIYIGVNHTFTNKNLQLDYLFTVDCLKDGYQELANNYRPSTCKKFYATHCFLNTPSQSDIEAANAESFYIVEDPVPTSHFAVFSPNITTRPLNMWASIIFPALEFALWTNPDEIYIVGCDCSRGHYFHDVKDAMFPAVDNVIYGWHQMAGFIKNHYPDMRVYSVNPVGLKGLFEDIYQNAEL